MTQHKPYTGPLKAVIFDWAGTTIDYGCFAPVAVFIKVFKQQGVKIGIRHARASMGLEKKDHIRAIAQQPEIAERWRLVKGRAWNEADIEAMYLDSLEAQLASVLNYTELIPGTLETIQYCREHRLKIGTSTGYSRTIMNRVLSLAASRGYVPDAAITPGDVPAGRPAPWMIYQNAMQLGVYPMVAMVKVGDTLPDIEEGLNSGTWTIGVTQTGNELGLSQSEIYTLPLTELAARLVPIEGRMREAGAHYIVRSIADVPAILADIETRLQMGEQP